MYVPQTDPSSWITSSLERRFAASVRAAKRSIESGGGLPAPRHRTDLLRPVGGSHNPSSPHGSHRGKGNEKNKGKNGKDHKGKTKGKKEKGKAVGDDNQNTTPSGKKKVSLRIYSLHMNDDKVKGLSPELIQHLHDDIDEYKAGILAAVEREKEVRPKTDQSGVHRAVLLDMCTALAARSKLLFSTIKPTK